MRNLGSGRRRIRRCRTPTHAGRGSCSKACSTVRSEKVAATVRGGKRRKFRFKDKLVSIDSTIIDPSLSMFDWAKSLATQNARRILARERAPIQSLVNLPQRSCDRTDMALDVSVASADALP